ncbi:acyl-CoA dehydrogenase family protein [Bacillus sp. AGMB 02131]|uniref:Acyl-CoA dehydrogenase family protein n=1 Tax=Peribacillus faecalis TaxID=2772559 RepID=A0A927CV16_9BACI|nr:acyl-CoA dehydrogenase family protein [Peribacillus faecalis]MBD3108333.1 acyl-CoA dehydrogenase family protein [Peribacillus faecalis]
MKITRDSKKGLDFLFTETEPEQVFTPEDLTEEHKMIALTAKQFVERDVLPQMEAIEAQQFEQTVALLKKAGALGLLGHSVPEKYGGIGLDKISKGIVGEVLGETGSYGVAHSNHTCIATLPITYFGSEEQKQKYLPKLASGDYIGAYCLTEPSSGSDALGATTTAVLSESGKHYILNGTKQWITNAGFSDTFIVYAKVDGTKFTAFIVEKDYPGLSLGPEEKKMGIKGSSTCSVILEDCIVPVENVLGEIGKGHIIAFNVLNLGRFNLGGACTGGAKAALKEIIHYTNERKQFKQSISSFRATQEKLADMASRIFAAESVQYRTAQLLESSMGSLYEESDTTIIREGLAEFAGECSICKVFGSETLDYVVDEGVQLHGGYGYMQEYRIERFYRDSRINRIFEGTNEINRFLVPNLLVKKAIGGEIKLNEHLQKSAKEMNEVPVNFDSPLKKEKTMVRSIRNAFLLLAGAVFEMYGKNIGQEQESLIKLSDIAIQLFAAESVILRAEKAVRRNGLTNEVLKVKLAESFIYTAILEVEMHTRRLLNGMPSSEQNEKLRNLIQDRFCKFNDTDGFLRKREIAARLIEAEAYIV